MPGLKLKRKHNPNTNEGEAKNNAFLLQKCHPKHSSTLVTVKKIHLSPVKTSTHSYVDFFKRRVVFACRNKKACQELKASTK